MKDKTNLIVDLVMMDKDSGGCTCCPCDATATRTFDQTGARYNDRSAFANNLQQDAVVQMQSMFQAQAQNALEQTPGTTDQSLAAQMANLVALINAAKA